MTFFFPTALWGLFAALIPIIIYLISLRNTRVVKFSTIRFIQQMEHKTIRKLKIKQWILIALRVAAIIAIVLMLARPVQQGFVPGWMAAEQESRVVIIVDNSASMAMKRDQKSLLEIAKQSIPHIVSTFEGVTYLHLIQTNPPKEVFSGKLSPGISFEAVLASIKQSHSRDNLWSVVDSVLRDIPGNEPNRECFILSDFPASPPKAMVIELKDVEQDWRFYCLWQEELENNVSITDIEAASQIKLPNHLLKLNTRISNDGQIEKRNIPVELYINGERVGQIVSHFKAGRTKDFLFQVYPGKSGIIQGVLELPKDDFSLDNVRTFELSIPDQISCQVIAQSNEAVFLLKTALESISGQADFLKVNINIQSEINQLYLEDTDVLILYDPGLLNDTAVEDLKKFLGNGGGLIWFSGENARTFKNKASETNLRLPAYEKSIHLENENFFNVSVYDQNHPILKDLNLGDLEGELPQVFRYNIVKKHQSHKTILVLNNGDPLLLELNSPAGKLYWFTSPLDLRWNDLAVRGLMVPLLHRLLILLATDENNTLPVFVDEVKSIELSSDKIHSQWTLVTPSDRRILVVPDYATETLQLEDIHELGAYRVLSDGVLFTAFSTRLSPFERPSLRATESEVISSLGAEKSRWIFSGDNLGEVLKNIRHGKSLWRYFLILAILLLLIESIVGRVNPESLKK